MAENITKKIRLKKFESKANFLDPLVVVDAVVVVRYCCCCCAMFNKNRLRNIGPNFDIFVGRLLYSFFIAKLRVCC